jgi:hypothetical protein
VAINSLQQKEQICEIYNITLRNDKDWAVVLNHVHNPDQKIGRTTILLNLDWLRWTCDETSSILIGWPGDVVSIFPQSWLVDVVT